MTMKRHESVMNIVMKVSWTSSWKGSEVHHTWQKDAWDHLPELSGFRWCFL